MNKPMYYADYLELEKILTAQHPKSSSNATLPSHDEMLFIIIHQAYELWFKQILHEFDAVGASLQRDSIDDNSEEMAQMVLRLDRVKRIIRLIIGQMDVLDTMQPLDFLEFRNMLSPASGFQSKQFRKIEATMGLKMESRHKPEHYKNTNVHGGGFTKDDHQEITSVENEPTLLSGLKGWLARTPFLDDRFFHDYTPMYPEMSGKFGDKVGPFFSDYFAIHFNMAAEKRDAALSVAKNDEDVAKANVKIMEACQVFADAFVEKGSGPFSPKEMQAALFISLYRHMPMMRLPYELITSIVEIDNLWSSWRYRHLQIVINMIGNKPGTGGSDGVKYLLGTLQTNRVFADLAMLPTFYLQRSQLPILGETLIEAMTFKQPALIS